MCLYKPKAVYAASERQYTAAGGEVQVPRSGVHEWQKEERGKMEERGKIHGLAGA